MSRTALSATTLAAYGGGSATAATAVDNSNGNTFPNDGHTFLVVKNGSGGSLTVTVTGATTADRSFGATLSKTYSVANGATWLIGPFAVGAFNQSDGTVYVDWSTGTSVTCGACTYVPTPNP